MKSGPRPFVALAASTLSIALGALPVFLLGALAVFVRRELGFGEAALGVMASAYYAASAALSVPGGRVAERVGARRTMAIAAGLTMVAMFGIAFFARSYPVLLLFMVVAGVANGLALPSSNLALARGIPPGHQGVAFGVKQSSGPIATLLAGAAVPLIGLTVGWRWAFTIAGVAATPLVISGIRKSAPRIGHVARRSGDIHIKALRIMALGAAFAVVGGSSVAAFYVESAVASGIDPGTAGTLLAIGSTVGILGRIGWGRVGDRFPSLHVTILGSLLGLGAVGYLLFGHVTTTPGLLAATLLTFLTGWAWPGLFNFAVVMRNPQAPGLASGVVATGLFAGGVVGPVVFGWLVERSGYQLAWAVVTGSVAVAGLLIFVGGRMLERAEDAVGAAP